MRVESDLIGEKKIPKDSYYGIHTKRALDNFPITGFKTKMFPIFINSFVKLKKCSALSNCEIGLLDKDLATFIIHACDKILQGGFHEEFVIDPIQGGAGTSMNMNVNEVISNIALELMGKQKGDYKFLSHTDHVNMGQSTNDTYPSSIKVAVYFTLQNLYKEMLKLINSLDKKAVEFKDVVKIGRTQLQDAVPMTLGQGFANYSTQIKSSLSDLEDAQKTLLGLNTGGTAIGTGIASHAKYIAVMEKNIKNYIGKDFFILKDLFAGTQDASGFSLVSGAIKRFALQLSKICNDLRLLSSGPRAGFSEIVLPAKQAGSSIMPGKINPVIPEVVNQVCFQIVGYDTAIAFAVEGGQLELNAFEPLIAFNLLSGASMLENALQTLRNNCIDGIVANVDKCFRDAENNIGIVTALNPYLGYKKSTEVAQKCLYENKSVYQVVLEMELMEEGKLREILDLKKITNISQ